MPKYRITEYRGTNIVGSSASGTSTICAKNLSDAQLIATCTNMPEGEWRIVKRNNHAIYIKGSLEEGVGNKSIIVPIPKRPENKDIEDSFTQSICENNIVTDDTYKMIQQGWVIRLNPFYPKYPVLILYDKEKGKYSPHLPITEEYNNPSIFKNL